MTKAGFVRRMIGLLFIVVAGCSPRRTGTETAPLPSASAAGAAALSVFDEMHAAACAGDSDKFFAHVVEPALFDNATKRLGGGPQAQAIARADFDGWRKDIKKANDGSICAWTLIRNEKTGGNQRVEVRSKDGDKRLLLFAEVNGQLKLIDYESDGPTLIAPTEPVDATVDVAELLRDYKSNELRGDNKYRGKRVRIVGKAGEFRRDATNTIYMTVGTGAPFETPKAQCFFSNEYANEVASLTKGSTVVVNGTVEGLELNVLLNDCLFPDVATLNVCYRLQNAGLAKQCQPLNNAVEETGFTTASVPANLPESQAKEWVAQTYGLVVLLKDASAYDAYTARLDSMPPDAGLLRSYVGSPAARIVVVLPKMAAPDLRFRIKPIIDRLMPSTE